MNTPRRAIILSAGQGKRLSPLTDRRPKCLIDLSGRTLLGWQLQRLHAAGVPEVVVVTGFGANLVEAEIARLALPGMQVRTQYNPFYGLADNLASCWVARHEFEGDVLLLNGDTLFQQGVAERLIAAPDAPITVTIDRKPAYDSDDMKVLTEGSRLKAIGKTIEAYDAESIGFLRFSAEGAQLFSRAVDEAMRRPEGLRRWYLSVIDHIAQTSDSVHVCSIEGLEWGEMDFPEDHAVNTEMTGRWARQEDAA
ncbi:NTP transferase domain-containing protein [Phenylobacterium deserti]|uniref:Nucleotidyltransferase n=1 Tax=Phenylobacterium deserti TaxID=1914756 RepID=A0A328AE18_9CAUL|nr:NTP transferase domain-containing protein [Phenylobacterium deserti]RAK52795.1 nucleotidyltransferase [Phenylobacterium deserti]